MSKMFDSLRRAELARRRRNGEAGESRAEAALAASETLSAPSAPSRNGTGDLPEEFVRELGMLRNSLQAAFPGKERRSLVFTSASHGEGVTTLALNYARMVALGGLERVLMVELNARRPSLFWRLGLTSEAGLTHYFKERRPLSSVAQTQSTYGFDVVHVGEKDPAQVQLHLDEQFPRFLAEASARYQTIIIDAPPVALAPETPPLTAFVDGVVMVVHCGKTRREIVQRSIHMIEQFEGSIVGIVLNRKKYYIPDFIYQRV